MRHIVFWIPLACLAVISSSCTKEDTGRTRLQPPAAQTESTSPQPTPSTSQQQDITRGQSPAAQTESTTSRPAPSGSQQQDIKKLYEIVQDARFSREEFVRAVPLVAALKRQLLARGLVGNLNRVYGWDLADDGNWTVQQVNDLMYNVVLAPGYDLERFLAAIEAGRRP